MLSSPRKDMDYVTNFILSFVFEFQGDYLATAPNYVRTRSYNNLGPDFFFFSKYYKVFLHLFKWWREDRVQGSTTGGGRKQREIKSGIFIAGLFSKICFHCGCILACRLLPGLISSPQKLLSVNCKFVQWTSINDQSFLDAFFANGVIYFTETLSFDLEVINVIP